MTLRNFNIVFIICLAAGFAKAQSGTTPQEDKQGLNPLIQGLKEFARAFGAEAQEIRFTSRPPSNAIAGEGFYRPSARSSSGLPVRIYLDRDSSGCSMNSGTVRFSSEGVCIINAEQRGNDEYAEAELVQQSFQIGTPTTNDFLRSQEIRFISAPPINVVVGESFYRPAARANSGLPVRFSLNRSSKGCVLTSGVVNFTSGGVCIIDAFQAGNHEYAPAEPVQQSFSIAWHAKAPPAQIAPLATQKIIFTSRAPAKAIVGDGTYAPAATATSGLRVRISLDAASTGCSLSGNVVSFTGAGICIIEGNQAGNEEYAPAEPVRHSFSIAYPAKAAPRTPKPIAAAPPRAPEREKIPEPVIKEEPKVVALPVNPIFKKSFSDVKFVAGDAANLDAGAIDSSGAFLTYAASGLPPNLFIDSSSGLITGTISGAAADGSYPVKVTASSNSGRSEMVFIITIARSNIAAQANENTPGGSKGCNCDQNGSPDMSTLGMLFAVIGLGLGLRRRMKT